MALTSLSFLYYADNRKAVIEVTKKVLITGVSSGIGRLTAELMAQHGWQVAATSRDPLPLASWANQHNISVFPLDVTSEVSVAAAVPAVVESFGRIDVLVNNAGYGLFGPLEGATIEEVEIQFRTNLFGVIALIRHVMPIMRKQHSGTIINVSSIGGRTAAPFASLYHASKFAIEGFSESFRYEASLHGIRVKLVEPEHFKTVLSADLSVSLDTKSTRRNFGITWSGYIRKIATPRQQPQWQRLSYMRRRIALRGSDIPSTGLSFWHSPAFCQTRSGAHSMKPV